METREDASRATPGFHGNQRRRPGTPDQRRPSWIPGFQFTDPRIEPLDFKISDWRDTVPRVVVGFGCSNNVVFNSATMSVEQSD